MSGLESSLKFLNTVFKQQSQKSTSQSTDKKEKVIADLDSVTQNNIQSIADNLTKLNATLSNIYKGLMEASVIGTPKTEKKVSLGENADKGIKLKAENKPKEEPYRKSRLSKKKQKKISGAQGKVGEKLSEGAIGGLLGKLISKASIITTVLSTISKILNASKKIAQDTMDLSSKYITSSSILIDKDLRSMQLGMGLSNKDAMSLSGAMDKIGIDKSDLAYLTQGQRDALNDIAGMYSRLYGSVDMDAISKLGNDLLMLQTKATMITEAIKTHIINILTALDPLIETVTSVLGQVFDLVNSIFGSGEFKTILQTLTGLIQQIFDVVRPLVTNLLSAVMNIVTGLMPIINVIAQILGLVANFWINVFKPILTVVANAFTVVGNILGKILHFLEPVFNMVADFIAQLLPIMNFIGDLVTTILSVYMNVLEIFMEVFTSILKPIFDLLSQFTAIFMDTFIDLINMLMSFLSPILEIITTVVGPIMKFLKPVFTVIAKVVGVIYYVIASVMNALIAIRNAIVWWDQKDYLDPKMKDIDIDLEISNAMEVSAKSGIASTYAGANNTSSISNKTTNVQINASYDQTISGNASQYASELNAQNYESTQVLAELVQGAL